MDEPILKREELKLSNWSVDKGWLILTPSRLIFTTDKLGAIGSVGEQLCVELLDIDNVRAKRASWFNSDVIEIAYRDAEGKPLKASYLRKRPNSQKGESSLLGWETAINDARALLLNPPSQRPEVF